LRVTGAGVRTVPLKNAKQKQFPQKYLQFDNLGI